MNIEFKRTMRLPEDNKIYDLPAHWQLFITGCEILQRTSTLICAGKRRNFIPVYQKEAQVKLYAGSMDFLTDSSAPDPQTLGKQDHIVRPLQRRLYRFQISSKRARQFVAMPLGYDYGVEAQITGSEFLSGIQL